MESSKIFRMYFIVVIGLCGTEGLAYRVAAPTRKISLDAAVSSHVPCLVLRSKPVMTRSTVLECLAPGSAVKILRSNPEGYSLVSSSGRQGYAWNGYLSPVATRNPTARNGDTARESENYRSPTATAPSTSASRRGTSAQNRSGGAARRQSDNNERAGSPGNSGPTNAPPAYSSGQITTELTCALKATGGKAARADEFGPEFEKIWAELASKGLRAPGAEERRHFYAQVFHESGRLNFMEELNPALSNISGGRKFKGRGPIQLTHDYNYVAFVRFVDLMKSGRLTQSAVARPAGPKSLPAGVTDHYGIMNNPDGTLGRGAPNRYLASLAAVWFWEQKKAANRTFAKNIETPGAAAVTNITRVVNGRTNGLADRQNIYKKIGKCVK